MPIWKHITLRSRESKKRLPWESCIMVLSVKQSLCAPAIFWSEQPFLWGRKTYPLWTHVQFSSVAQSCLTLCDPMNLSSQASLSITNSRSLLKLMSIESVMPSSHLILCHSLFLLPPIPPSIRVFFNESTLHEVAKVLEFQLQHQSFQWTPRTDLP